MNEKQARLIIFLLIALLIVQIAQTVLLLAAEKRMYSLFHGS